MLTATYSLVAIAAEQDRARSILHRVRQIVCGAWQGLQGIDVTLLHSAFGRLAKFDEYCRQRKMERYLIPALRSASRECDVLLAELDALSEKGADILRRIRERLTGTVHSIQLQADEIRHSMERYCENLSARLQKEEDMLLPMARRLLSTEDWFALASEFLTSDRDKGKRLRGGTERRSAPRMDNGSTPH